MKYILTNWKTEKQVVLGAELPFLREPMHSTEGGEHAPKSLSSLPWVRLGCDETLVTNSCRWHHVCMINKPMLAARSWQLEHCSSRPLLISHPHSHWGKEIKQQTKMVSEDPREEIILAGVSLMQVKALPVDHLNFVPYSALKLNKSTHHALIWF